MDLAPLIRKLEEVDLSSKKLIAPTGSRTRSPTEIAKEIYELELEKHFDKSYILEDNITKLYSLIRGQYNEALQQGLRGHEYFEDKDISFDAKWLLHQIKLTTQGIK